MSPPTREREITLTGQELSAINSLVLQTSQRSHQTSSASHCWSQRNSGFAWLSQKITLQTTLLPFSVKVFFYCIPSIYWLSFYFFDIWNIICKLFVSLPTQETSGLLSFWSKLLYCRFQKFANRSESCTETSPYASALWCSCYDMQQVVVERNFTLRIIIVGDISLHDHIKRNTYHTIWSWTRKPNVFFSKALLSFTTLVHVFGPRAQNKHGCLKRS